MAVICAPDEPNEVLASQEDGHEGKRNARREALAQLSKNLELSELSFSWKRPEKIHGSDGGAVADLMSSRRETALEDLRQRLAARCASPELEKPGQPPTPAAAVIVQEEEAAPIPPLMQPTEDLAPAMVETPSIAQPSDEMRQLFMSAVARSLEVPSPSLPMRTDSFSESKGDVANLPENDNFFANLEALKEKLAQRKMRSRSNSLVGAPLVVGGSEGHAREEVPPSPSWRAASEGHRPCSAASSTHSTGPHEATKHTLDPAASGCTSQSGGESPSMPRSEARKPRAPIPTAPRGPRSTEVGARSPQPEASGSNKDDEALCESGGDALLAWANEVLQKAGMDSPPGPSTGQRQAAASAVIGQKSPGLQPTPPPPRSVRNATPRRRHFVPEGSSSATNSSAASPTPTYVPSFASSAASAGGEGHSGRTTTADLNHNCNSHSSPNNFSLDSQTTSRQTAESTCSSPSAPSFPPRQSRRNNSFDAVFGGGRQSIDGSSSNSGSNSTNNNTNSSSAKNSPTPAAVPSARSPGDGKVGQCYSGGRGLNLNMNINNLDAFLAGTSTTTSTAASASASASAAAAAGAGGGPMLDEAAEARKRKAEELREQWNRMSQEADTECERLASEEAANRATFSEESDKWKDRVTNAAEELRKNVGSFAFQGASRPPPYSYSSSSTPGNLGGIPSSSSGPQSHRSSQHPPLYPPTSARQAFGLVGPAQQAAWEQFEASWAKLEAMLEQSSGQICCSDIPWPSDAFCITGVLPHDSAATAKKRLAVALRRWHPDKWKRILDRVPPSEQMLVTERVKDVAQRLLVEKARLSGPGGVIR